jgi:hypothetical protein
MKILVEVGGPAVGVKIPGVDVLLVITLVLDGRDSFE